MELIDLITPERVASAAVSSKKRALEQLSHLIVEGQEGLSEGDIFDSLIARERLGSTGLGHGVAIPHGRVKDSDKTVGAFLRLPEGIDFGAIDQQPVDLLFALLVPEHSTEEHLQLLAKLAAMFSDQTLLQALRESDDPQQLFHLIESWRPAA